MQTETVRALIHNFALGDIVRVTPVETSGNLAYSIEASTGIYFLRLCPEHGPRWRSESEIQAEVELLDHLAQHIFPVLPALADKDGKRVITWENHNGYLRAFAEGEPKLQPTLGEVETFGKSLGTFHTLIEKYKTPHAREHVWDPEHTKRYFMEDKEILLRSNLTNAKEFIRIVEQRLEALYFPENLSAGTIHEDLGKRHVLWRDDTITSVIDFDRAYYGKLVFDLGQAARGWCFTDEWKTWSDERFRALVRGYEKARRLTELEKEFVRDAIAFAILERAISFALRYVLDTHDPADETFAWSSVTEHLASIDASDLNFT